MIAAMPRERVSETARRVLSQAAFLFPEAAATLEAPPVERALICVSVAFSGSRAGVTTLTLPLDLCTEIASNMLGADPATCATRECQEDAARELANIITGQLLTEQFGHRATFDQRAPEVTEVSREDHAKLFADPEAVRVLVDGAPILITFVMAESGDEHQSSHS